MASSQSTPAHEREPRYSEVLVRPGVRVPMRDGVSLATDLYLPAQDGRVVTDGVPTLLMRTPYGKGSGNSVQAMRWARHGYVIACQDVRGRYESEGEFAPFIQEAEDGYDAVEWLAAQAPCDGRVGTLGGSYLAYAQAAMATQAPPHLAAMCHFFGYPHGYHSVRQGGALDVFWLSYFVMMAADGAKESRADPNVLQALREMRFEEWLDRLPLKEGQTPLSLAPSYERAYFDYVRHETLDDFWKQPGLSPALYLERFPDVPTLWICGWFDHYPYADPDTLAFTRLTQMGQQNQYVVFGPWTHGEVGRQIGQVTFGEGSAMAAAFPDYELVWFDRWLKDVDDEGLFAARAKYFVMGGGEGAKTRGGLLGHGGRWETAASWPPEDVSVVPWYLHPSGELKASPSTQPDSRTVYLADPSNPAPSSTGVCYTVTRLVQGGTRRINTNGAWDQVEGPHLYGCQPPYRPLNARADVLTFQTDPLTDDIEVTGHPIVELWIESDAPDTDFVAKLIDVYPSSKDYPAGLALGVTEGIQRAKFRDGFEEPKLLSRGQVYLIRVRMRPVSNRFRQGHRIRIDITSSGWPHFDVNTHTGRNPSLDYERRVARNTVYHDHERQSRVLLPVAGRER